MNKEDLHKIVYEAVDGVELTYDYCYCDDVCSHGDGYLDRGEVVDAVVEKLIASQAVIVYTPAPPSEPRERTCPLCGDPIEFEHLGACTECYESYVNR